MKIITVECFAKPGKSSELVALCKNMIAPSRAETGCIHYSFYQDLKEKNRFLFYEEWKDQKAIDVHNKTKHFLEFQSKFTQLIIGESKVTIHTV